ncbi:glycosyltransferase [Candidatus Micrarchaeota archaeon]|nr:glycosyltransferase [Candidatus Micrarchaeota archaeon]
MKKALFIHAGLQQQEGSAFQYAAGLMPGWRKAISSGRHEFEPILVAMRDPGLPIGNIVEPDGFEGLTDRGVRVFASARAREKCFFVESKMGEDGKAELEKTLLEKFGVECQNLHPKQAAALLSFWKAVPLFARALCEKGEEIAIIDANDWAAFPAGFLASETLGKPLSCRFHSGECGRALGRPDPDSAALQIEAAALCHSDYVQAVSVHEAKFEIGSLMPHAKKMAGAKPGRAGDWKWREGQFERFLLLESQEASLVAQCAAGVNAGINLEPWREVRAGAIAEGRDTLAKLLPGKEMFIVYSGRDWKGADAILDAFASLRNAKAGLLLLGEFDDAHYAYCSSRISKLGIGGGTAVHGRELEDGMEMKILCAADAIALPSSYAPSDPDALKALAANLSCETNGKKGPVLIASDTGGMHDILSNGINGFKIPMGPSGFAPDAGKLAGILKMAIDEPPAGMTAAAAQTAERQSFNWQSVSLRIQETYRKAIENHANAKR